jgi:CRP-like cAMP-binding protein
VPSFPNETKTATLAAMPLFEAMSRKELAELAMMTDDLEFPAGKVLCRQGDIGSEFLVIIEGEAEVTKDGAPVNTLGPGDYFGEIALVEDVRRTATVTAATPLPFFVLTRQAFRTLVQKNPKVEAQILDVIAARVARTEQNG